MSEDYKGVALPWGPTIPEFIEPKDDDHVLRSSIYWILCTRIGERVMLPEFGSNIHELIFDPNDQALQLAIETGVKEAIRRWDDRVEFMSMDITQTEHDVICNIHMKSRLTPLQEDIQVLSFSLSAITPE